MYVIDFSWSKDIKVQTYLLFIGLCQLAYQGYLHIPVKTKSTITMNHPRPLFNLIFNYPIQNYNLLISSLLIHRCFKTALCIASPVITVSVWQRHILKYVKIWQSRITSGITILIYWNTSLALLQKVRPDKTIINIVLLCLTYSNTQTRMGEREREFCFSKREGCVM